MEPRNPARDAAGAGAAEARNKSRKNTAGRLRGPAAFAARPCLPLGAGRGRARVCTGASVSVSACAWGRDGPASPSAPGTAWQRAEAERAIARLTASYRQLPAEGRAPVANENPHRFGGICGRPSLAGGAGRECRRGQEGTREGWETEGDSDEHWGDFLRVGGRSRVWGPLLLLHNLRPGSFSPTNTSPRRGEGGRGAGASHQIHYF